MNRRKKVMVLWHSERGSCVKEDLRWLSKIIQRKGKANATENKKVNTYKLHPINRLNVLMYWRWWRMKAIKGLESWLGVQVPAWVILSPGICCLVQVHDFISAKKKLGIMWSFCKGCQKIFFTFRPFNGPWKNAVIPGHCFYSEEDSRFEEWFVMDTFRKKNYYSSIVGPPKKSLIAVNAGS